MRSSKQNQPYNRGKVVLAYKTDAVEENGDNELDAMQLWTRIFLCPIIVPCLFCFSFCSASNAAVSPEDTSVEGDNEDSPCEKFLKTCCSCLIEYDSIEHHSAQHTHSDINKATLSKVPSRSTIARRSVIKTDVKYELATNIARTDRLELKIEGYWFSNTFVPSSNKTITMNSPRESTSEGTAPPSASTSPKVATGLPTTGGTGGGSLLKSFLFKATSYSNNKTSLDSTTQVSSEEDRSGGGGQENTGPDEGNNKSADTPANPNNSANSSGGAGSNTSSAMKQDNNESTTVSRRSTEVRDHHVNNNTYNKEENPSTSRTERPVSRGVSGGGPVSSSPVVSSRLKSASGMMVKSTDTEDVFNDATGTVCCVEVAHISSLSAQPHSQPQPQPQKEQHSLAMIQEPKTPYQSGCDVVAFEQDPDPEPGRPEPEPSQTPDSDITIVESHMSSSELLDNTLSHDGEGPATNPSSAIRHNIKTTTAADINVSTNKGLKLMQQPDDNCSISSQVSLNTFSSYNHIGQDFTKTVNVFPSKDINESALTTKYNSTPEPRVKGPSLDSIQYLFMRCMDEDDCFDDNGSLMSFQSFGNSTVSATSTLRSTQKRHRLRNDAAVV